MGPTQKMAVKEATYDAESGNRTRATLVGGECSHHCALPVKRMQKVCHSIGSKLCVHFAFHCGIFSKISHSSGCSCLGIL